MAPLGADDLPRRLPGDEGVRRGVRASGTPRAVRARRSRRSLRADRRALGTRRRSLERAGVRFSSVEGDLEFYVDPVPRVITAADWSPSSAGSPSACAR